MLRSVDSVVMTDNRETDRQTIKTDCFTLVHACRVIICWLLEILYCSALVLTLRPIYMCSCFEMPGEITGLAASQTLDHIIQFVAIIIHIAIDTTLVYTYPQPSLLISNLLSLPLSCLVSYIYYIHMVQ